MVSDAAMFCASEPLLLGAVELWLRGVDVPGVDVAEGDFEGASVMVDWEEEREKVLARGARCVSLSSVPSQPLDLPVHMIYTTPSRGSG